MIRQGNSEIQNGAALGAGVVPASTALAGLEAHNVGALPFIGRARRNMNMTIKTKLQTHTPGPWTLTPQRNNPKLPGQRYGIKASGLEWIAADTRIANARLIAAAPELLAALKHSAAALDYALIGPGANVALRAALVDARAAIAKAEVQEVR